MNAASFTADIGNGQEEFDSLAAVQSAVYARVSGLESSAKWYRKMRNQHGAKVRDAQGLLIAYVSYNARAWDANGNEIV
jgi:hypothetical protein